MPSRIRVKTTLELFFGVLRLSSMPRMGRMAASDGFMYEFEEAWTPEPAEASRELLPRPSGCLQRASLRLPPGSRCRDSFSGRPAILGKFGIAPKAPLPERV